MALQGLTLTPFSVTEVLRINPLVLAEATYLFAKLTQEVFALAPQKLPEILYKLEFQRMSVDSHRSILFSGKVGDLEWDMGFDRRAAPDSDASFLINWNEPQINPGRISFLLVSKVCEWFGCDHEKIPYKKTVDGNFEIDDDSISQEGS